MNFRYLPIIILFIILFHACDDTTESGNKQENESVGNIDNDDEIVVQKEIVGAAEIQDLIKEINEEMSDEQNYLGHWIGNFGKNMINITLISIDGDKVKGYSICAGNFRKIKGKTEVNGSEKVFTLREPGSDKFDGFFRFTIDTTSQIMEGTWTPYNSYTIDAKSYSLRKKKFVYKINVGKYPDASQRMIPDNELAKYSKEELTYILQEIYARHGYCFKDKKWRYIFEKKSWYMPLNIDIRTNLSAVEKENLRIIQMLLNKNAL